MIKLHVGKNFSLPPDMITNTTVVYGGKGMGKTNFGAVVAEELYKASLRFSVIDQMGVWWGLQHGRDRTTPGLPVLILGGPHGDLPIEPTGGVVVADLVVDETVSVVIDISRSSSRKMWSKGEKFRFVTDYFTRLYERQGEECRPILQIIDEAARYAPQMPRAGDVEVAKCLGMIETVAEEGRNIGIGLMLLTQRSARLNKNVAELADCMVAFRTVGPNSVAAILDWFGEHIPKERHKGLVEQVRKLPVGTALVVSPGWLDFEGAVEMRARETFDSSRTPTGGGVLRAPGEARKPDLEKYRQRMAATIERAKAEDPRELKRQNTELRGQLAQAQKAQPTPTEPRTIEVSVFTDGDRHELKECQAILGRMSDVTEGGFSQVHAKLDLLVMKASEKLKVQPPPRFTSPRPGLAKTRRVASPAKSQPAPVGGQADGVTPARQRILDALAWLETIGLEDAGRIQLALLADASPKSSAYSNNLGGLRTAGLIDYSRHGRVILTEAGRAIAQVDEIPRTSADVQDAILRRLVPAKARILQVLIGAYPQPIRRDKLAGLAGASATSSAYSNNLGSLRSLGVIEYGPDGVMASTVLFLEDR